MASHFIVIFKVFGSMMNRMVNIFQPLSNDLFLDYLAFGNLQLA